MSFLSKQMFVLNCFISFYLNFKYFYVFSLKANVCFKVLFEMIIMFSETTENFITTLLWLLRLYQGAKMFPSLHSPSLRKTIGDQKHY